MDTSTQTEMGSGDPVYTSAVEAAALLSTAADPNRMAILTLLAEGTTCVCALQEQIPVAPNLLSYHLKVLRDAGLVISRRRGRWMDYELAAGALGRLRRAIPLGEGKGAASAHSCSPARRPDARAPTRVGRRGAVVPRHGGDD
jgi:ArsR family transcriptional regulator, arsenate/arsenite/antimonite-responsive transcriptional repressor